MNVVVVDWSSGGNTWNYYKAAINTRIVGYQIARFTKIIYHFYIILKIINKIIKIVPFRFLEHIENATVGNNDDRGSLYLVGHSLGAHICGFAAKELKRGRSKWTVKRITGLDPAQPCFKNANPSMKLHKSDASFVDIIHTNGRLLSEIGLGLPEPIG